MPFDPTINTFAGDAGPIPLSELDNNFSALESGVKSLNNFCPFALDSGVADAYVVNLPSGWTVSLAEPLMCIFIALNTNTGASTLNGWGTGVKAIRKAGGTALAAGDIVAGQAVIAVWDAANDRWMKV